MLEKLGFMTGILVISTMLVYGLDYRAKHISTKAAHELVSSYNIVDGKYVKVVTPENWKPIAGSYDGSSMDALLISPAHAGDETVPDPVTLEPMMEVAATSDVPCTNCEVPVLQQSPQPAVERGFAVPPGFHVIRNPTPSVFKLTEFPQPDHFTITSGDLIRQQIRLEEIAQKASIQNDMVILLDRIAELESSIGPKQVARTQTLDDIARHVNTSSEVTTAATQEASE